jgi:hypothetical protein
MVRNSEAIGTKELFADLLRQISALLALEVELFRVELSESSSRAATGLAKIAAGAAFLLGGFLLLLTALCAFLVRLGLPIDLACLIVAAGALLTGWLMFRDGTRALEPGNLLPQRSLNQVSSLIRRA